MNDLQGILAVLRTAGAWGCVMAQASYYMRQQQGCGKIRAKTQKQTNKQQSNTKQNKNNT